MNKSKRGTEVITYGDLLIGDVIFICDGPNMKVSNVIHGEFGTTYILTDEGEKIMRRSDGEVRVIARPIESF